MNLHHGHEPSIDIPGYEGQGVDLLLTEHDDGTRELAVRPGKRQTWMTWGPPTLLHPDVPRMVAVDGGFDDVRAGEVGS